MRQFADGVVQFADTVKDEDMKTDVTPQQAETYGFALADHARVIQEVCNEFDCFVSIRETGRHSLTQRREHFAAKGHHILQKSLKDKSLTPEVRNRLADNDLATITTA